VTDGTGARCGGADGGGPRRGAGRPRGRGPSPRRGAVDPDVDLHDPAQRAETAGRRGLPLLAVIAAGGALGACARHAVELWLPARGGPGGGVPWGVLLVNVAGCALIGVVMVLAGEAGRAERTHPLVRPFLGVGVLGGFTTFSAYAADGVLLLGDGREAAGAAAVYLAGTLVGSLAAVWGGATVTRALLERRRTAAPGGVR
jgi:CrcB protein